MGESQPRISSESRGRDGGFFWGVIGSRTSCSENSAETSWKFRENSLKMLQKRRRNSLKMSWSYRENSAKMSGKCRKKSVKKVMTT